MIQESHLPLEEPWATSLGLSYATGNNLSPLLKANQEGKDRAGTCAGHACAADLGPRHPHVFLQCVSMASGAWLCRPVQSNCKKKANTNSETLKWEPLRNGALYSTSPVLLFLLGKRRPSWSVSCACLSTYKASCVLIGFAVPLSCYRVLRSHKCVRTDGVWAASQEALIFSEIFHKLCKAYENFKSV